MVLSGSYSTSIKIHRIESHVFIDSGNSRDRIANEANFVDAERVFILADRKNAIRDRQVFAGDNCKNARQRQRFRRVDVFDERVRHMTAQDLAEEHARQNDVVGELRLANTLRARINFAKRLADDIKCRFPFCLQFRYSRHC